LAKPTEAAELSFLTASKHVRLAGGKLTQNALSLEDRQIADAEMARAVYFLAVGFGELSAGLRATHTLLEQVQAAQHLPYAR
jgi:pyruvate kinase